MTSTTSAAIIALCAASLAACTGDLPGDPGSVGSSAAAFSMAHVRVTMSISVSMTRQNAQAPYPVDSDFVTMLAAVPGSDPLNVGQMHCQFASEINTPYGPGISVFPLLFNHCDDNGMEAQVLGYQRAPLSVSMAVPSGSALNFGYRVDKLDSGRVADEAYQMDQAISKSLQTMGAFVGAVGDKGAVIGGIMQGVAGVIDLFSNDGSASCGGPLLPHPGFQVVAFNAQDIAAAMAGTKVSRVFDHTGDPTPAICGPNRSQTRVTVTLENDSDPAYASVDVVPVTTSQWWRTISLHVSDSDGTGWASIENGQAGDAAWLDRSFDGGTTWEPSIANTSIPAGLTAWRTLTRFFNSTRGIGLLRACGKAGDRPEIACTPWFGLDPARARSDDGHLTASQWWRAIALHVSSVDGMGWASIQNGRAGDEVWIDRSFDGGATWEPQIADATIPAGSTAWRTLMRFIHTNRGAGQLRACGKAGDRPEIACTAWSASR